MHEIRLAGPWEVLSNGHAEWQRTTLPYLCESPKAISLRRRFHRPSGLEASTRVELRISTTLNSFQLWLNDESLDPTGQIDSDILYDLTQYLQDFNSVKMVIDEDQKQQELNGVWLRIVESASDSEAD